MWRLGAAAVVVLGLAACSDPEGCRTRQDCFDLGQTTASCVGGVCLDTCTADPDCRRAEDGSGTRVCERGICIEGCGAASAACGAGESCVDGRCSLYTQSFESAAGSFSTLETFSFNDIDRPLRNRAAQIVWTGLPTCTPADRPERCAGPAAEGDYFLVVERAPTPATATFEFGPSCGACTCCRACRDPNARPAGMTECFGTTLPDLGAQLSCGATPPDCTAICQQCEQCPTAPQGTVGMGLDACAEQAAQRTCPGCPPYDTCVAGKFAEGRACPGGNYPACPVAPTTTSECQECMRRECDAQRPACWACRDVVQLKEDFPADPSRWAMAEAACDAQAANGCYPTPINAPRSVLTDDEQAIESPAIPLAGRAGDLVLQFQYIPFNIGATYRRVLQGQDRRAWPLERQEIRVQLCGGSCTEAASWRDGVLVGGAAAVLPRDEARGNGLQFGGQSGADWRVDILQVAIPPELRTDQFRFRLLPRLADGARVGVDRIQIRRLP